MLQLSDQRLPLLMSSDECKVKKESLKCKFFKNYHGTSEVQYNRILSTFSIVINSTRLLLSYNITISRSSFFFLCETLFLGDLEKINLLILNYIEFFWSIAGFSGIFYILNTWGVSVYHTTRPSRVTAMLLWRHPTILQKLFILDNPHVRLLTSSDKFSGGGK